ncbi:hypothetical protein KSW97_11090 [Bacteroides stercoris]|uniref:hypothetical protein n=1 Tax=Bacteroides stercoris TaxID=46506 RepID=UPI0018999F90|nr:hypothetical protein [Bacteroides stercoris]MBV3471069.1 hypothetical protein [Bacteroides stercoris]MBV3493233.1 hypothetical protein [Bacteroides stercoris]MDY5235424.1 hypothetical protein [Bacteroides stercoris]
MVALVPSLGIARTILWYSLYQRLVLSVPPPDILCTLAWYFLYRLVKPVRVH